MNSGVSAISARGPRVRVKDGGAQCWGDNFYGQLGDGTTTEQPLVPIINERPQRGGVIDQRRAPHTCALKDGGVKCWGWNGFGQLGNGTTTRTTPASVVFPPPVHRRRHQPRRAHGDSTATPVGTNSGRSPCDPNETSTNVGPGPSCNLFICQVGSCAGAGEGDLVVIEHVSNVTTSPVGLGLGAYEFNVEFDSFVIQSVDPADIIFTAGCPAGPCGTAPSTSNGFAALGRGAPNCSMTILFENSVRFGCVTSGQNAGPLGSFDLARLDLVPSADDVKDRFPGNDNGIPTLIKDNQCELADVFGHPVQGTIGGAGLLPSCGDLFVTVRILEGDLNLDCVVNLADEAIIAQHYGAFFGSAFYQKWYDLEPRFHDLDIDIKDVQKVFGREGSTCQAPIPPPPRVPPLPPPRIRPPPRGLK